MKKKIHAKDLVQKLASMARERMVAEDVVSLQDVRKLKGKKSPPTILVIEDDETVRKVLKRVFESSNYNILEAQDATDLEGALTGQYIDLILMDVGLPWINGYELAKMMKEHRDLQSVPIVFVSGNSDLNDIKRGFAAGAHDYITKPFDVEKVKKTVDTLLKLND